MRALVLAGFLVAAACSPPAAPEREISSIVVSAPVSGSTVSSPLRVEGVASNDWYFEAIFDAQLLDANGAVIAEAPAQAQTDWTVPGPVPFVVEFTYASPVEQQGTIVLIADSTGEPAPPRRETRVPVVLAAAP